MKLTTTALLLTSLLTSVSTLADPNITISTSTTSRDYPLIGEEPLVVPLVKGAHQFKVTGISGECAPQQTQKIKFNSPIALDCQQATEFELKIRFSGDYALNYDSSNNTLNIHRAAKKSSQKVFKRPIPNVACEVYRGGEVTIALGDSFAEGTRLRDAFTGQEVVVENQQVKVTPSVESGGMVMLERADQSQQPKTFNYRNANIYFVMVDRFNNGDSTNDHSYGRQKDNQQEIGTFHGGDLKGVTAKLDYIKSLGTDVIWLSPIVEQVHGFVGGGDSGSFPFYAYHGYWTRDFTKIDENFGRDDDLRQLVNEAHKRGIKVLLDAVVNHPGYATLADLQVDGVEVVTTPNSLPSRWQDWQPKAGETWHSFHANIDYNSVNWSQWWGGDWVRAGLPGYPAPGSGDTTLTLAGLPDFLTESDKAVVPPQWLLNNPGTRVVARDNYTVADYLIEWQTDWVKRFGVDGYRVDTVKHVEGEVWQRLKRQATAALEEWRAQTGKQGEPFWMMGEVWGHTAYRSPYFDDGFDALINFDMQKKLDKGAACFSQMASTYQSYADTLTESEDFNPVSYMSSHDTELFFSRFNQFDMQRNAANALLLSPGAIQVYYGDEVGRPIGPYADDFHQGTRSKMIWQLDQQRQALLEHWQTLGQFRQRHPAVGAGSHSEIPQPNAYVFSRTLGEDTVVVAFVGHNSKP